jgi:hypothetical protein
MARRSEPGFCPWCPATGTDCCVCGGSDGGAGPVAWLWVVAAVGVAAVAGVTLAGWWLVR